MSDHVASRTGLGPAFTPRRRGPARASLTLEAILGKTVEILDGEGTDKLTFRSLAHQLGAGVASLYWYVDSRDALMELALDRVLGELIPRTEASPSRPWTDELRELGDDFYRLLLAHRWASAQMLLSASRGPNALTLWEYVARALVAAGFSVADSLDGLSLMMNHILASGIQEANRDGTGGMTAIGRAAAMRSIADDLRALDPNRFPTIVGSADAFETHDQARQFRDGLDVILTGLARKLDGTPRGHLSATQASGSRTSASRKS